MLSVKLRFPFLSVMGPAMLPLPQWTVFLWNALRLKAYTTTTQRDSRLFESEESVSATLNSSNIFIPHYEQLQTEAVLLCADGIEQHFRRELVYPSQQVC